MPLLIPFVKIPFSINIEILEQSKVNLLNVLLFEKTIKKSFFEIWSTDFIFRFFS